MANFPAYPKAPFSANQNFLARDPTSSGQVIRVQGQGILDAAVTEIEKSGKVVQSVDTLTEAKATDYPSGTYVLTGGELVVLDGGQAIYRVSDPGSGGIIMDNGNELVLEFINNTPGSVVESIDSVADLFGLVGSVNGQQVSRAAWHPGYAATVSGLPVGGGIGVYDSTMLKSRHDGGTIFSPTVPWTTNTAGYLAASSESDPGGSGCWVFPVVGTLQAQQFGATGLGVADDSASLIAAIAFEGPGGALHLTTGVYFTTETIYIPFGFTLRGDGLQPAANIAVLDPKIGTTIFGNHTGAAVVSLKAAYACVLDNFSIVGDISTIPQTGLCIGRGTAASAGRHTITDVNVAGWFSKAAYYSIASEENIVSRLRLNVIGGLAPYSFFTSESDELSVDTLFTSSNFTMYVNGFNILHQADYTGLGISNFPIYISAGTSGNPDYTANLHFTDGFTGAISNITDSRHMRINLAEDAQNITFENIGCESFNAAAPPLSLLYVSGAGNTLRGLKFKAVVGGQFQSGQSHFVETEGGVTLDGADIDSPGADHKSEFSVLNHSNVNILDQDVRIISGSTSNQIRGRQIYLNEVGGSTSVNNITQSPTFGPLLPGNPNLLDMSISVQSLYTGTIRNDMAIVIDGTGSPNTFKWGITGIGVYVATAVAITGAPQLLQDGIYIEFVNTTGHNIDELWQFYAEPNIVMA